MDSQELIDAIGKQETSAEVQAILHALGWTKKLKVPKDDIDVRADVPAQGLNLVFEPDGPKTSVLRLAGVIFLSDREKGYKRFAGALPADLSFDDTQAEARAKLGKPSKALPNLRRDIWKHGDARQIAVNYAKDKPQTISLVTVELRMP